MIVWGYILSFLYAFVCVLAAFVLNKAGVNRKITRKIVHISIGFEWVILYHFFGAGYHFLTVCLACLALLILEYKLRLVPALSSDSDNAPGTVYYGLAMSIMALISAFLPDMMLSFGIGVFATSVGDGMAGVVGQLKRTKNPKIYGEKTLYGALSIFLFTFLGALLFKYSFGMPLEIWQIIIIAVFAASVELVSIFGLDNITVTLGTAFLSYAFLYIPNVANYLVPIVLTPVIIAFASGKKVLTRFGVLCALILDIAVSLAFGNAGFTVLLTFLVLSVVTDKIKRRHTAHAERPAREDKHDTRNGAQVFANGIVSAVSAILFLITKNPVFTLMYIASVAEAFADTVASGIGVFARNTYDLFRFRRCEQGMSGGMSLIGTAASLAAALLISALSSLLGMTDIKTALILAALAFLGMIFDSLLGSLLQVKYKCSVCDKITEKKEHCGAPCVKRYGISFVNNDAVNLAANAFSAVLALFMFLK